jgi:uncharacterized protein with ParB-like and HNH nuclease domain
MTAKEKYLNKLLERTNIQFTIPVFQRNYDWKIEQCEQLLSDIQEVGENDKMYHHFIGSIVYLEEVGNSDITELIVIDGQQRLTTLFLIYFVLLKKIRQKGDRGFEERILDFLINREAGNTLKIKPFRDIELALQEIWKNLDLYENGRLKEKISPMAQNLVDNFEYFNAEIKQDDKNIEKIWKGLEKLLFIEVRLDKDRDDPQRVFQSMNTTGLELSESDKIRNFIMMKLNTEEQYNFNEKYWEPIEKLIREKTNEKTEVSSFIRDFLTLENEEIPNKKKVYETFKVYLNQKLEKAPYYQSNLQKMEPIMQYMRELAELYVRFYTPSLEPDSQIQLHLKYLGFLDCTVVYPFLMKVYHDYVNQKIAKDEFIEVLEILQSYFIRRLLLSLPSNAMNKVFMNLYNKIDPNNYTGSLLKTLSERIGDARFPSDKDVDKKLKEEDVFKSSKKRRYLEYVFNRLESYRSSKPVWLGEKKGLVLGRIFPENNFSEWGRNLLDEEIDQMQERSNTLANLAYSGCKDESKSFTHKKIEEYDQTQLWSNRYLSEIEEWGIEQMNRRHEILMKRFFDIWKGPISPPKNWSPEDNTLKNIFEIESATRKRVEKAVWEGEELELKDCTFAALLTGVITKLLETHEKELLRQTNLCKKLKLRQVSEGQNGLKPVEVNGKYFIIETHSSSDQKLELLQEILDALNLQDSLYLQLYTY